MTWEGTKHLGHEKVQKKSFHDTLIVIIVGTQIGSFDISVWLKKYINIWFINVYIYKVGIYFDCSYYPNKSFISKIKIYGNYDNHKLKYQNF